MKGLLYACLIFFLYQQATLAAYTETILSVSTPYQLTLGEADDLVIYSYGTYTNATITCASSSNPAFTLSSNSTLSISNVTLGLCSSSSAYSVTGTSVLTLE